LNNRRYAGAYAYGRRHYRRAADEKKVLRKRENDDWLACIPNAHPGCITWEQFQENLKILKASGRLSFAAALFLVEAMIWLK
jgi:hypothetical protein